MDLILRFMTTNLFSKQMLEHIIAAIFIFGAILTVVPFELGISKITSNYAVQIMFAYLILGVLFLFIRRQRLVFISFFCCGALCLFLKKNSNATIMFPKKHKSTALKVACVNTSDTDGNYKSLVDDLKKLDADLISIQEVTPDWVSVLEAGLSEVFPYSKSVVRIDFFGQAVFSKYPLEEVDTFHYKDIPNIIGKVRPKGSRNPILFVSSHTAPSFESRSFYEDLKRHLNTITDNVKNYNGGKIALGTFNTVEWSAEIQDFRYQLQLNNSRRNSNPFTEIPYDHIFYSEDLECTNFTKVYSSNSDVSAIGIQGTYQFKSDEEIEKTVQ